MRYTDIRRYLKPYRMYERRKTTINHAFASAIAPFDVYSDEAIRMAVKDLGQDPDAALTCVYCGDEAETWDHVFATVEKGQFSGAGHRLGNLLPCCKPCNSKKGNKDWLTFVQTLKLPEKEKLARIELIARYLAKHFSRDSLPGHLAGYAELISLRDKILSLMKQADDLALVIREKMPPAVIPMPAPSSDGRRTTKSPTGTIPKQLESASADIDEAGMALLCEAISGPLPPGATCRAWTLREDNGAHFHGKVHLNESPLYLRLSWRPDKRGQVSFIGTFKLDLRGLLQNGSIRHEPEDSLGPELRLRVKHAADGEFYVQTREGAPRCRLPVDHEINGV